MSTRPAPDPNYLAVSDDEFARRVDELWRRYADCDLCAYDCGVDRTAGETGVCRIDDTAHVSSYFDHHGEEAVLWGHAGSGTIFLAHCNMACVFCQNFETSHEVRGEPATPEDVADMALELQARGCHNVNFVSPTHRSPHLVEAVRLARDKRPRGSGRLELRRLRAGRGPRAARRRRRRLHARRQVERRRHGGRVLEGPGVLVERPRFAPRDAPPGRRPPRRRRRVLDGRPARPAPGHARGVENARGVLSFLADEVSRDTFVNVMAQYRPHYRARTDDRYEAIGRGITHEEYAAVVRHAREVGLERVEHHTGPVSSGEGVAGW